jgi:hypothetical protein
MVSLKEEHILQAFENKVLRKVFEPNMDEENDQFRIFHKEELHQLRRSLNNVRIVEGHNGLGTYNDVSESFWTDYLE